MSVLFLLALICVVFAVMGALVYRGSGTSRALVFVKVFISFTITLGMSALALVVTVAALFGVLGLVELIVPGGDDDAAPLRLPTTDLLLVIFLVIFIAAILHYLARRWLIRRRWFPDLDTDQVDITEYLIQWSTIFLAVYQFLFDGLGSLATAIYSAQDARTLLQSTLTPQTINLVLQPLLISSWVVIAMEKLHRRVTDAAQ